MPKARSTSTSEIAFGRCCSEHAHPAVVEVIQQTAANGTAFGALTPAEAELGQRIAAACGLQRLRFVNSGTEATMTAIRLARAAASRDLVVKFDGNYHGHSDGLLVKAGSGVATLGLSDSAGVPAAIAGLTAVLPYNDVPALEPVRRPPGRHRRRHRRIRGREHGARRTRPAVPRRAARAARGRTARCSSPTR
ncbi:MAG: aminotransferase class III-fold pyridoxal phosphate-dependent enzyme [Dehalococcoidia bacterium]